MKCSSCGFENAKENKFCTNCGQSLVDNQNYSQSPNNNIENNGINVQNPDNNLENNQNSVQNLNNNVESFTNNLENNEKLVENNNISNNSLSNNNFINNNLNNQSTNFNQQLNNSFNNGSNNSFNSNYNNNVKNNNKKNMIILFSVLAIIVLAIVVCFGIMYLKPTPKRIFSNFTNSLYSSVKNANDKDYKSLYFDFEVSPKVSGTDSEELESIIKNFNISVTGGIDYKNKTFLYDIKTDYNNEELLYLNAQYDKDLYLTFESLYDKPVKMEENDFSDMFEKSDTTDFNVVAKGFVDAFNKSLDNSYFKEENKEIEQNGKKIKAKVISLTIDENNYKEISNKMRENLKNNEEFIKSYANINDSNEEEVKEMLNEDETFDFSEPVTIDLYTTGITNKFVKLSLTSDTITYELETTGKDNSYILTATNDGMKISLNLKYNQEFNKEIKLKDVSDAITEEEAYAELSNALPNITKQKGYIELNDDFEDITGSSIEEFISALMGASSSFDTDYDYSYDDYDYGYGNYDSNYNGFSTLEETYNY